MPEIIKTHLREEEAKEKIKILEQIKISKIRIAYAILVLLELKPATEIYVYQWNEDPASIKAKLESAGLIVREKGLRNSKNINLVTSFAVTKDSNTMDSLMNIDSKNEHEEYGRLMGYPETAVKAFSNESDLLPKEDYPDRKGTIFSFRLSKENYKEEFEVLKKWSEAIKKYSPDIYAELSG